MLISEYLLLRNQANITTGKVNSSQEISEIKSKIKPSESEFAQALKKKLEEKSQTTNEGAISDSIVHGVEFSKHAIERLSQRNINIASSNMLERLNKGVELAAEKGSQDTLVLVDSTAFVVSVKNNKVITTLSQDDLKENVFTKIDSTVIM